MRDEVRPPTPGAFASAENFQDRRLLTPGPLTTSATVKAAMLHDFGSRDARFIDLVRHIRASLCRLGHVAGPSYTAVLMQGSGTFGIEAVLGSAMPRSENRSDAPALLVAHNGAYGRRMVTMAGVLGVPYYEVSAPETEPIDPRAIAQALSEHPDIDMVAVVHCETTTGVLNPIEEIGALTRRFGKRFCVDAMSSFGALPLDVAGCSIDFLVSSANKCIEGVPGFSFILAGTSALAACEGCARSLSLDLHAQWLGLETDGQFRFTPPTHALLAFHQALAELDAEGGITGRLSRYRENHRVLNQGMQALGFRPVLRPEVQAPIITAYFEPKDPKYDFRRFYEELNARGYAIYPGKLANTPCFRMGNIGRLFPEDFRGAVSAVAEVVQIMGFDPGAR